MAREELKWQNIDADDLPAAGRQSPRRSGGLEHLRHDRQSSQFSLHFVEAAHGQPPHYGWRLSLLLLCSGIARREGKLNDWMPVLIVGLFVVCVTAFLLMKLVRQERT